ncbi:hypothetical protein EJ06DRAFT_206634 [Trichodelitschia bisporula]|uniref:Uncharacterized protein n=1 Tax=Trichodelitschia bisporula TaxID=703511 RepID=A0A6G1I8U6_9PEZI|nr:hypothetical protein EJ06DRAFT_206634 [Trichodelitschia bisporula]
MTGTKKGTNTARKMGGMMDRIKGISNRRGRVQRMPLNFDLGRFFFYYLLGTLVTTCIAMAHGRSRCLRGYLDDTTGKAIPGVWSRMVWTQRNVVH